VKKGSWPLTGGRKTLSRGDMDMKSIRQLTLCAVLVLLTAATAFSTNPTTTGALLTINGTVSDGVNTISVRLSVSDKDIHSGNPQTVLVAGNCTAADQVSTDAYVMQAGAPTGCDPGNAFEGGLSSGSVSFTSSEGDLVSYDLSVRTSYVVLSEGTQCNTSETICSNNTSFLTVMNNSGSSSFTGTITLAASSPLCGTGGLVFDSFTGTLPADIDASATLALAQDASSCGGFTSLSSTQTLEPGVQSVYTFFNDKYKITPSPYSNGGESLTITFVPVLYSVFTPPANFSNEACVPFGDVSPTDPNAALGTDVCVNYQADCSVGGFPNGGDCTTLLYTLLESYDLPPNLPAIGGPDFLVVHGAGCPTSSTAIAQSIFTDYFVTRIDPTTKGKGSGTGSCFEVTYTPGATPITGAGTTTTRLVAWESPLVDTELNMVKAGSTRPLAFQLFDVLGNPVTNLNWCANATGTGCTAPWVNLSYIFVNCPAQSGTADNTSTDISSPGSSGFQNLGSGNYQMNWKTQKVWKGSCANVEAIFDNGVAEFPADLGFQFN
jgi:hypothetical protein